MAESLPNMQELFNRLRTNGTDVPELIGWRQSAIRAILLATESGAHYIIEPIPDHPSRISRFAENTPYHGEQRLPGNEIIYRKPGNPSKNLIVGKPVEIYGLPRRGDEFDPDSSYQTLPLIGIRYL